jgi:hypothetical protein
MQLTPNDRLSLGSPRLSARLPKIAVFLVIAVAIAYYGLTAFYTDISFDGAIFLQPVVALERYGVLTHTYNIESPADFRLPLNNLGQGMLSQSILNWPFIHFFGINHFTLQASNLIFLLVTGLLICALIVRLTGSWWLSLVALILFYTLPWMKALGLQGHGEVPAAAYLLLCALVLISALSSGRHYFWLGFVLFLAFHTKYYLIVVYPILLAILFYIALRQKTVRFRQIGIFSLAFWTPFLSLPLIFLMLYGRSELQKELVRSWGLVSSTQWGEGPGAGWSWDLFYQAIQALSGQFGGWLFVYVPLFIAYAFALIVILRPDFDGGRNDESRSGHNRLAIVRQAMPRLDPSKAGIVFLFAISFFFIVYWFHFSTSAIWFRRLFPFMVLNIPLLLTAGYDLRGWTQSPGLRRVIEGVGIAAVALFGFGHLRQTAQDLALPMQKDQYLVERIEASEEVKRLPPGAKIFAIGWWQAPKISLFAGRSFLNLTTKGQEYEEGYLVLDREELGIDPDGVERVMSGYHTELVWQNKSNKIYRWKKLTVDLAQAVSPSPIELWRIGPDYAYTDGTRFYPQPGDTLAMWAQTRFATQSCVLLWDNVQLNSGVAKNGELITAIVPRTLFQQPGIYSISVYDRQTRQRSGILKMRIEWAPGR